MIINLDTDLLKETVRICAVANEEIDTAVEELNRITIHNDWCCKERDAINDYTVSNKMKISHLQDCARSFLNVLTQVSDEFEERENTVSSMFDSVDSLIGTLLTASVGGVVSSVLKSSTGMIFQAADAVDDVSKIFGGAITGLEIPSDLTQVIQSVDFINLGGGN